MGYTLEWKVTMFMRKVHVMEFLQRNYCNLGHLNKVNQSKLVVGQSAAGKNTISSTFNTQETHLVDKSCSFVIYQKFLCYNCHALQ